MNELVQQLIQQLGVTDGQAKGGAGLLFKLAKDKLGAGDFAKVAEAVPGSAELMSAAPESGGASKLLGGLASSLGAGNIGDLAGLAEGFSKLGLDKDMVAKFLPIVLSFVQSKGGSAVKDLLAKVLQG